MFNYLKICFENFRLFEQEFLTLKIKKWYHFLKKISNTLFIPTNWDFYMILM